jgi:hypothetical protein
MGKGSVSAGMHAVFIFRRHTQRMSRAPTETEAVRAAIEALGTTVALAAALAEAGRRLDLAGLDQEAASVCAAAVALQPGEGRSLRPALEEVLRRLDQLQAALPR